MQIEELILLADIAKSKP